MNTSISGRRIAVTGASGFLGVSLVAALKAEGAEVLKLVRRKASAGEISWNPAEGKIDAQALEGMDAVVHLAGEGIAGLWTRSKRRRILESREAGTRFLAETLAKLNRPPAVLVSASAVGYYGDAGETALTESSPPGEDFLARVCVAWEAGTRPAADAGIRIVHTRFGLILDHRGGALRLMLPIFRLGLGGRLGSGRQWMSWISLHDAIRAIRFALTTENVIGPFNTTTPHPVRNAEFTRILARSVRRPAVLAVPSFLLRTLTGGMADALLLPSQRALPQRLLEHGFEFEQPTLESAVSESGGRLSMIGVPNLSSPRADEPFSRP